MDNYSDDFRSDVETILKNYNIVVAKRIPQNVSRVYLKDSQETKCRFCKKVYPEIKFKDRSHTIPEFLGNKILFSKYECDNCNKHFSIFENDLSNFMNIYNAVIGIRNKKNRYTKYKQNGQPIIVSNLSKVHITDVDGDKIFIEDSIANLELELTVPSYIPVNIYRCLVKIAISILPEKNLEIYSETIKWLMNPDLSSNMQPYMLFSLYPYNSQSKEIAFAFLEKKDECLSNFPHSIFYISNKNYAFQICIPYCLNEKLNVPLEVFPFAYPTLIDLESNSFEERENYVFDLSSKAIENKRTTTLIISGGLDVD